LTRILGLIAVLSQLRLQVKNHRNEGSIAADRQQADSINRIVIQADRILDNYTPPSSS
jgi:hypothetical protein